MTLAQLLVVQEHDSAIDRLRHRRENLPEQQALVDCDEERAHLDGLRSDAAERRHAVDREQKRREDEAAMIQERRDSESARLYSGSVTAHKDLQAIQSELDVLAERQSAIEDDVLELMEQGEPIDAELASIDDKLEAVAGRRATIEQAIADAQAEIDAEIAGEQSAREAVVSEVSDDLVAAYEQARAQLGGVGIARLNAKTCEGCHLQLSAVAFDRVRKEPSDAVVHCPECERILVRS